MQVPREFLGVGWKFPLRVNALGAIPFSQHEQNIEESIWIILSTAKGERVMQPQFGCGIHNYVFAANNPATRGSIAYEVQNALALYEDTPNRLLILVDYRVNAINSKRNLVYPFYLTES